MTCLSSGRFTLSASGLEQAPCAELCWVPDHTHLILAGEPLLPGEVFQQRGKSLSPEKLLKGERCPFQTEQSTRADGDKDFADVHI